MATNTVSDTKTDMSVGTGLALAGIWLATSAVSIIILLTLFVWSGEVTGGDAFTFIILILLIAAPLITAYSITKKILNLPD